MGGIDNIGKIGYDFTTSIRFCKTTMFSIQVIARFCRACWYDDPSLLPTHNEVAQYMRECRTRWLYRPDLEDSGKPKPGIREAISLLQILMVEIGALITYAYITPPKPKLIVIGLYIGASLIPLFCMYLMTILRQKYNSQKLAHDRSTIMFIRYTVMLGLLLVGLFTCAYAEGKLSGDPLPFSLPIVKTEIIKWDKPDTVIPLRDDVIYAYASFNPRSYSFNLPKVLVIDVLILKDDIRNAWEIMGASPYIGGIDSNKKANFFPTTRREKTNEQFQRRVLLWDIDKDKQYTIKVLLHKIKPEKSSEEMKKLIDGEGNALSEVLEVTAYIPQGDNK